MKVSISFNKSLWCSNASYAVPTGMFTVNCDTN